MSNINIEELRSQLQQRLDAIQIDEVQITDTSYMDDVQVGAIDTRNPIKQRETYSNDLEGELLQRFDETRDYQTRMQLFAKIKQERERKLIEKAKEQQRIEKEQKVKAEFVSELKDKEAELSEKITELQQKIIGVEAAKVKTEDQIEEQKKIVIKGVKVVGEKVYKAAQDEINRNRRSVKSRVAKIKSLEDQRAEAQADFDSLNAYIKEISLGEKEDEKVEQHKQTEGHSEKDLPAAQGEKTDNDSQNKQELDDETFRTIQAIFDKKPKTSSQTITVNPTQKSTPKENTTKPQTKTNTSPQNNNSIGGVRFYIESGKPIYEVAISINGVPTELVKLSGWNAIKTMKPDESQKILKQIDKPDKYYDQNIASILQYVDSKYGTKSLAQYIELLKTKPIKDGTNVGLKIDYDFSNLGKVSKENKGITRYIKKIANANYKLGRVSYEKSPNFFRKLWNKMQTLKLNPGEMERNIPIKNDQYSIMKMEEELKSNPTHGNFIDALKSLGPDVLDPNFDISEFAKAYEVSEEEVKKCMQDPKIMGMSRSEAFRLSQKIDKQLLKPQKPKEHSEQDTKGITVTPIMHDEK